MKNFICILLLAALLFSCARQGSLTGGQKDTTPPVMDTLHSSPNYVTRFKDKKIELEFNEWVVLTDATKEVVISPPIDPTPKVTLKKKSVIVTLDDKAVLRENTTYTINFGNAVRDLHEKNPAKDLRFVFSTGDAIDSLVVEGLVLDALTGEPVENAVVMLYDNLSDSAIVKEKKPYYFAKTEKSGQFKIKNVKSGQFQAIAVEEGQVGNLRWDRPDTERIGFPDSLITLSDSLKQTSKIISIFKNQGPIRRITANSDRYGLVKIVWSDKPDNIPFRTAVDTVAGFKTLTEYSKDTMLIWYDFPPENTASAWTLITGKADTVRVKALSRADFVTRQRIRPLEDGGGGAPGSGRSGRSGKPAEAPVPKALPLKTIPQIAGKPYALRFNSPIASFDTAKWVVTADTLPFRDFNLTPDSTSVRSLLLKAGWKSGNAVKFMLLPGAVTDFYGVANIDTILYQFNIATEKQLGILSLTVENAKPGEHYVLEILNGQNKEAERRFTPAPGEQIVFKFTEMMPANYTAKIIIDKNNNGRWDTGNYFEKRQPEVILLKKLEALRANWELEATVSAEKENVKRKN